MFIVLYSFEVIKDKEDEFIENWAKMTELIKEYSGGLGSKLHKTDDENKYLAYAQWPNKETWEKSYDIEIKDEFYPMIRKAMRSSCHNVETIYRMEVVEDLLIN